jgi:hypothetical protein
MNEQSLNLNLDEHWEAGIIANWYLRPSQIDIYILLMEETFPFIQAARRFGKTTSILAFVQEQLRQNAGWICRWCFPFKSQAREVLLAEMEKMQATCPEHLKMRYQVTDSVFVHPNGSKMYIRGVNEDRGESARGPAANIIICDEYGFWAEPEYTVRECLFPQLENQEGRHLIKASTPPRDLGHKYYEEREIAKRKNRFISKTILDNEALGPEELQEIIDECGGVESTSYRRERLCEDVSDPEMLIIPEYREDRNMVSDDYERPAHFTAWVGGDSGADDNTALLFAYYDFLKDELVIEDEIVVNGKTTKEIVDLAKPKETSLWGEIKPKRRVYDAPKQLIYDIFVDHKWPVQMPQKDDKTAAIHDLRVEMGAGRIKIKEKCKQLNRQLKVGIWKDERHTDFERTEGLGHLDAIAALIYLNRTVDRKINPWPALEGKHRETHFITKEMKETKDPTDKALTNLFGRKK